MIKMVNSYYVLTKTWTKIPNVQQSKKKLKSNRTLYQTKRLDHLTKEQQTGVYLFKTSENINKLLTNDFFLTTKYLDIESKK